MKYLLTFLSFSLLFSQELEVEGDLKVTGTVESTTIDSLEQVISQQQILIDSLFSNQITSKRIIQVSMQVPDSWETYWVDGDPFKLDEIMGMNQDWYVIDIINWEIDFDAGWCGLLGTETSGLTNSTFDFQVNLNLNNGDTSQLGGVLMKDQEIYVRSYDCIGGTLTLTMLVESNF